MHQINMIDVAHAQDKRSTLIKVNREDIDGLGTFLFQMHSKQYVTIFFLEEETSLQFYEHVVVASITKRLWCFPKNCRTFVMPRFKIVEASFTYGPTHIPRIVWILIVLAIFGIGWGVVFGGCPHENSSSQSIYSIEPSAVSCGSLIIGCLVLIPVPLLLLVPCCFKWHHVNLDVKSASRKIPNGTTSYNFRFKKIRFEQAAFNAAVFDEFYIMDYVYGPLGTSGKQAMSRYHLLSHLNNVNLANPISTLHVDDSVRDIVIPAIGCSVNGKKDHHRKSGHHRVVAV